MDPLTKDKGNLGELKVMADLAAKGISIAQPYGDNLPFDLIAITRTDTNFSFTKVQVKHVALRNGKIEIRAYSQKWNKTRIKSREAYKDHEVDIIAAYCPDVDKVFYVRYNEVVGNTFNIRVYPAKNNQKQRVHLAEEYTEFPGP